MTANGMPTVQIKSFIVLDVVDQKDYIITNGGPIVTFRSDNMTWDFKNLSVREIKSYLT